MAYDKNNAEFDVMSVQLLVMQNRMAELYNNMVEDTDEWHAAYTAAVHIAKARFECEQLRRMPITERVPPNRKVIPPWTRSQS